MSVSSHGSGCGKAMECSYQSRILLDHSTDGLRSGEGAMVALADGSLLLHYSEFTGGGADDSRALIAEIRSTDNGVTWSEPKPVFQAPAKALNAMSVSLLRLQDGRIGSVFADSPLAVAFSDDDGRTWSYAGNLEGTEKNYCYFSLLFHQDRFFTTYYESAVDVSPRGDQIRRNLASLKFGRGDVKPWLPISTT